MNLDELYERVTEAIVRAERLEVQGASAALRDAFMAVVCVEEAIARVAPTELEAAIARRGAARAARKARSYSDSHQP